MEAILYILYNIWILIYVFILNFSPIIILSIWVIHFFATILWYKVKRYVTYIYALWLIILQWLFRSYTKWYVLLFWTENLTEYQIDYTSYKLLIIVFLTITLAFIVSTISEYVSNINSAWTQNTISNKYSILYTIYIIALSTVTSYLFSNIAISQIWIEYFHDNSLSFFSLYKAEQLRSSIYKNSENTKNIAQNYEIQSKKSNIKEKNIIIEEPKANFTVTLENWSNPAPNTFEVDVVLKVNDIWQGIKLWAVTFWLNFNDKILNNWTPCDTVRCWSWSYISGSTSKELQALNTPYGSYIRWQLRNTQIPLRSYDSINITTWTYILWRYRFTNTVPRANNSDAELRLQWEVSGWLSNTIITFTSLEDIQKSYSYTTTNPLSWAGLRLGHTEKNPFSLKLNTK